MTDPDPRFLGTLGPAHPDRAGKTPGAQLLDVLHDHARLRVALHEVVEELEADGHHGCAEIVRAKVWEAG